MSSASNFPVDINTDNDGHSYLHIDILNSVMYDKFRKSPIDKRKLFHIWPHGFLLTAIKNTDIQFFIEIINDIIKEEETFLSICGNRTDFFNHILGNMYLDIVRTNGLRWFEKFLLHKGVNFNIMNDSYNSFIDFVPVSDHVDMLAVFLEQKTRNLEVKIEISLHIAVRGNDIICTYMLINKGACTDYLDNLWASHLNAMTINVDMIRLILAEELLNITTQHNYHKIVQDILGEVYESPINLNVVKNTAAIRGNHDVLRRLLKLQPELINDLIINAYQLLKETSRKIHNYNDRLEYLDKILGHECENVHCNDDEIMIFRMLQIQPHDKKDEDFNFFERNITDITVEYCLPRFNICILCCDDCRCCHLCPMERFYSLLPKRYGFRKGGNSVLASRLMIFMIKKILLYRHKIINYRCYNYCNSRKFVDLLASLLEEVTTIGDISIEAALNNVLHIAVKRDDLISAYMLLCKGASASDPNTHNITALHLAARNGNVDMVRLIMMASQQLPDIDSYRDDNNQTTREVIRNLQELSFHSNFLENLRIPQINSQTFKFFLNNSDETTCLKVMKEGFFGEFSLKVAGELLNIAMQHNYYKIIREILRRRKVYPTSSRYNDVILRALFKLKLKVTKDSIIRVCRQLKILPQEIDNTSDRLECLQMILEQEHMDVRCTDVLGNTPLHYALKASNYEAAILLLKRGSYLGHVNKSNNIAIANIPASVLSSYFNDCIQLKEDWTDECTIQFDYRCLMPHADLEEQYETYQTTGEMEVILYIANNDTLKHLVKHSLLSSFLYIKWYRIRHVLYANFVFYIMFYFFLNAYVLNMTYTSKSVKQIANDSFDTVFANTLQRACSQGTFLRAFVMGMLLLFACREFLQLVFDPWRYLTDLKNWSQILLIVLTITLLYGAEFQIGFMVILLSTWELITLISHHLLPSTSTAIEMFRTVFFNFVCFLFPYIFLILAFALAFHILFRNDSFSNFGLSLFKIIVMLTGEFDANNISFSVYPIWSRLVFVLFVLNIVIVLLNLLNGLAISNILEIRNKSEIIGLISRIRLIAYLERMIIGKPIFWHSRWIWWDPFNFLLSSILLFSCFLRDGKMNVKPYRWSILKMDPNIIKHAKRIVYNKNEPSNNDVMNEFAKLQTRLTQMKKVTLKCNTEENNF